MLFIVFSLYNYENFIEKVAKMLYNKVETLSSCINCLFILYRKVVKAMKFQAELNMLRRSFDMLHIRTRIIERGETVPIDAMDMGLRQLLEIDSDIAPMIYEQLELADRKTLYTLTDSFACSYQFFILPDEDTDRALLIGPYLSKPITRAKITERCRSMNISLVLATDLERYFASVPILPPDSHIFLTLDAYCATVWGTDSFDTAEIGHEPVDLSAILSKSRKRTHQGRDAWNMKAIEERYSYENEIIKAVSKGQAHKAKLLMSVTAPNFERRSPDLLRDLKNYSIIMNTLLRKAAESGGVHPVHLDSVSSDFALKIERLNSSNEAGDLMVDMFMTYCRLVKKYSIRQYSPPVQKALTYIESDLSADLSLSTLAAMQNISASYLSNIFKKETDKTVTEYVNGKRMDYAAHLLATTKQQIQSIAQICGIMDVQYFSKLFKKVKGMTPKEYRKARQNFTED